MKYAKKAISLVIALAMLFAMAAPAWADDDDKGTTQSTNTSVLTIETSIKHTYKIYQLLKGDIANLTEGSGTLSNVVAGENLKLESQETVKTFIDAIQAKQDADLGDTVWSYVTGNAKYTVTGTGNKVDTNVENGYYLVMDTYTGDPSVTDGSDTVSRYMVAVAGDTTVSPKISTPSIDKKIIDTDANKPIDTNGKTNTASIGDVIEYEITGSVPDTSGYKYYYYILHDTLSEGLTLDEESFVVKIGAKTLVNDDTKKEYYIYPLTNAFRLAIEDLKQLVEDKDNGISVGSTISIKYSATVNEKAAIGTTPNTNTVKLEYSNNPNSSDRKDKEDESGIPQPGTATGKGPDKTTKTYITALTILKVDNNGKKLRGAEFTLTGENLNEVIVEISTSFKEVESGKTGEYYKLMNGTYTKTAPSNAAEGEEGYNKDLYESQTPNYVRVTTVTSATEVTGTGKGKNITGTVNEEGYVIFTGLNAGKYTLSETKTPAGYNTMEPIEFTISATTSGSTETEGGSIVWHVEGDGIVLDSTNGVFDSTITNKPGSLLPSTGGTGTTLFYIVGGALAVGALVLLVTKRRMDNEED